MVEQATAKNNDVELDTDDVQETNINLDVQEDENKHASELKKEEVDLGYTDISTLKKEKAQEKKEEPTDAIQQEATQEENKEEPKADLNKISDNAQKRIKELTFKYRESERREKAALEYAKGLQKKYQDVSEKYETSDEENLKQYDARIDAERDKVKRQLKEALDSQDSDKVMEANDALTRLAVEKEKVRISLSEKEKRKKETEAALKHEGTAEAPTQVQEPPKISAKAQAWAQKNEWFGTDRVMTSAAMGLHDDLIGQGIEVESDDYYNEIDRRMQEYFPQKFNNATDATEGTSSETATKKPVQNVAGVSRKQAGRRTVKLTKSQVAIAKKLGVPLEEYAKFVKEDR